MADFTEDFYLQIKRLRSKAPDFRDPEMERSYYENSRKYSKISDGSVLGVKLETYLRRYKDYYFTIFHLDERHRKDGLFDNYFVALIISNSNITEEIISDIFGDKYFGIYRKENDENLHKDYRYFIIKSEFEWNVDHVEEWFREEIDRVEIK